MLKIIDGYISRGDFKLKNINLEINSAEYFILLGPSGAGKTLLLETIAGLERMIKGKIFLGGRDVTNVPPEERGIGYLPQDLVLFPHLGVRENILFGARARKLPLEESKARLEEMAGIFNLEHLLPRPSIKGLSEGEKQRVALARILILKPSILLLDEPVSSVDQFLRRDLLLKLKEINRLKKVTILHVTHEREEAFMLGDRIALLIGGEIHQVGTRDETYYHPQSVEVARFLLNENIFQGRIVSLDTTSGEISMEGGGLFVKARQRNGFKVGDRVLFGIRPEEVMLIRPDRPLRDQVRENQYYGKVNEILNRGGNHILFITLNNAKEIIALEVPNCAFRDMGINMGQEIIVCLKKSSIWVLADRKNSV